MFDIYTFWNTLSNKVFRIPRYFFLSKIMSEGSIAFITMFYIFLFLGFLLSFFIIGCKLFDNLYVGILAMVFASFSVGLIGDLLRPTNIPLLLGLLFMNLAFAQFGEISVKDRRSGWVKLFIFSLFAVTFTFLTGIAFFTPFLFIIFSLFLIEKTNFSKKAFGKRLLCFVLPLLLFWLGLTYFSTRLHSYYIFSFTTSFQEFKTVWLSNIQFILLAMGGFYVVLYWLFYNAPDNNRFYTGLRITVIWLLSLLALSFSMILLPITLPYVNLPYYFIAPIVIGFAFTLVDVFKDIKQTILNHKDVSLFNNGKVTPLLLFALFLSFSTITLMSPRQITSQREVHIRITSYSTGKGTVWHGLALDSDLNPIFPANQPEKVIGQTGGNFTYSTTPLLSLGTHRIEYGAAKYDGTLPAPWHVKIYVDGEQIVTGVVKEKQFLKAKFTVERSTLGSISEPVYTGIGLATSMLILAFMRFARKPKTIDSRHKNNIKEK